jgi:hypothetical protein
VLFVIPLAENQIKDARNGANDAYTLPGKTNQERFFMMTRRSFTSNVLAIPLCFLAFSGSAGHLSFDLRMDGVGTIDGYLIQGAPDLGITLGDPYTASFLFLHEGSFEATVKVGDVTFTVGPGDGTYDFTPDPPSPFPHWHGIGAATIFSPNHDYSAFFSEITLTQTSILAPGQGMFGGFTLVAVGDPTPANPQGSRLEIAGGWDPQSVQLSNPIPDATRTDTLLLGSFAVIFLITVQKRRSSQREVTMP